MMNHKIHSPLYNGRCVGIIFNINNASRFSCTADADVTTPNSFILLVFRKMPRQINMHSDSNSANYVLLFAMQQIQQRFHNSPFTLSPTYRNHTVTEYNVTVICHSASV